MSEFDCMGHRFDLDHICIDCGYTVREAVEAMVIPPCPAPHPEPLRLVGRHIDTKKGAGE